MLIDRFQRKITYLRVSVTDRCNFRCVYCLPPSGVHMRPHAEILTYEEITSIVRVAVGQGIERVRITGGEPLIRRGIVDLIRSLHQIDGLQEISLTTNGFMLEQLAWLLAEAGLSRINVSFDTLAPAKFAAITRGGSFEQVWRGILAAEAAGLIPIKVNAVIIRGVNDDDMESLARLTERRPWQVRFIELMPVGNSQDWGSGFPPLGQRYVSVQQMHAMLQSLSLQPEAIENGNGPARVYRIPGAVGTIGFISPIGEHFCEQCNRLRLTADGALRPCLLLDTEMSLRDALRRGEPVEPFLQQAIDLKPEGHELEAQISPRLRHMSEIGG